MRTFVLGLLVGGGFVAAACVLAGGTDPGAPAARGGGPSAPAPGSEAALRSGEPPEDTAVADRAAAAAPVFPPGEFVLRIGEGYVFEDDHARRRAVPGSVDVYCQDIRHGVSLYCPGGAAPARAPMTSVGLPERAVDAAALVDDAPSTFGKRNLALKSSTTHRVTGFGFVRAANGRIYELVLLSYEAHPEALKRSARIAFEAVPSRLGGGELDLPQVDGTAPLPSLQRRSIRRALEVGRSVPGDSFARRIAGDYQRLDDLARDTAVREPGHYFVDEPLRTTLTLERAGAVWAPGGVVSEAAVLLPRGGAFGTSGDLEGMVRNNGYAYMYVGGDLLGTVHVDSYATVVIEGDLRGTLRVRSYTDLYLAGRVLGTLDCKGSCWSTFYFRGYWSRGDLERLGKGFRSVTLHVEESDLESGVNHDDVGSWREVIVGDESWTRIAR